MQKVRNTVSESRKKRLEQLFHQLADLPAEEREERLNRDCDDPSIRAELLALLQFDDGGAHRTKSHHGHKVREDVNPESIRIGWSILDTVWVRSATLQPVIVNFLR